MHHEATLVTSHASKERGSTGRRPVQRRCVTVTDSSGVLCEMTADPMSQRIPCSSLCDWEWQDYTIIELWIDAFLLFFYSSHVFCLHRLDNHGEPCFAVLTLETSIYFCSRGWVWPVCVLDGLHLFCFISLCMPTLAFHTDTPHKNHISHCNRCFWVRQDFIIHCHLIYRCLLFLNLFCCLMEVQQIACT